jgi:hypothetical protein
MNFSRDLCLEDLTRFFQWQGNSFNNLSMKEMSFSIDNSKWGSNSLFSSNSSNCGYNNSKMLILLSSKHCSRCITSSTWSNNNKCQCTNLDHSSKCNSSRIPIWIWWWWVSLNHKCMKVNSLGSKISNTKTLIHNSYNSNKTCSFSNNKSPKTWWTSPCKINLCLWWCTSSNKTSNKSSCPQSSKYSIPLHTISKSSNSISTSKMQMIHSIRTILESSKGSRKWNSKVTKQKEKLEVGIPHQEFKLINIINTIIRSITPVS